MMTEQRLSFVIASRRVNDGCITTDVVAKKIAIVPRTGISFGVRLFHESLIAHHRNLDSRPLSDHPPTGTRPARQTLHAPSEVHGGSEKGGAQRRHNPTSRRPIRSECEPTTVRAKLHHPICRERQDQIQRANPVQSGGWEMSQSDQVIHFHGEPTTFRLRI